jgi:hypothetical protein
MTFNVKQFYAIVLFLGFSSIISAQDEIKRFTPAAGLKVPYVAFYLGANYKIVSAIELGVGLDFNATSTLGRWVEAKYFIGESFKGCQFKQKQFFIVGQLNSSSTGIYLVETDERFTYYAISEGLYLNWGAGYRTNTLLESKDPEKKDQVAGFSFEANFQGAIKKAGYSLVAGDGNAKIERGLDRNLGNYFGVSVGFFFVI